jgi:hypothetical protein
VAQRSRGPQTFLLIRRPQSIDKLNRGSFGWRWSLIPSGSFAVQTGNGAPSGGHYTLNIIGVKNDKTAMDMTGNSGHRIFVLLSGPPTKIMLAPDSPDSPGFTVLDANGTDGLAEFQLPKPDPEADGTTAYSVFARALGTPGGKSITTTCATDPDDGSRVCSGISLTLERKRGQSLFENVSKWLLYIYADTNGDSVVERVPLFDDKLQGYFWSTNRLRGSSWRSSASTSARPLSLLSRTVSRRRAASSLRG